MKVMLVSQYFYPEQFKCNDVAFDLVKRGYEVTVATGIPNYPDGKFFNGYGIFKRRKEKINGVNVIRIPLVPRGKGRGFEIAINGFSWALIASVWAFFHATHFIKIKVSDILDGATQVTLSVKRKEAGWVSAVCGAKHETEYNKTISFEQLMSGLRDAYNSEKQSKYYYNTPFVVLITEGKR